MLLRNRWVVFAHDLLWIPAVVLVAYWVRFNLDGIPRPFLYSAFLVMVVALPVHAVSLWVFGCYRGVWRFASIPDLVRLMKSVVLGALVTALIVFLVARLQHVPRSVLLIYPVFLLFALSGSRMFYRATRDLWVDWVNAESPRALIVGAGAAGETLIRELKRSHTFAPVALLDDDPTKFGHEIQGVRVRGATADLRRMIQLCGVKMVLVAMPTAPRAVLERVVQSCNDAKVQCRTLPSVVELAGGVVEVSRLRRVTVEDLLARDPIKLDSAAIAAFLRGRRVLVTGGGGSIGAELCRQIAAHAPARLAVLDNSEYNLYRINGELQARLATGVCACTLGDVRNRHTVDKVFQEIAPEVVFHAAAYKHVTLLESNPIEAIDNNVLGTRTVADAAVAHAVGKFIFVSTDKTVRPTSVMGATKHIAELYCQASSEAGGTQFVTTRFGNVLASAGSVVPLFERQIAAGGPLTVTHPEVTRYFMTIPEAVGLILEAGAMGRGGDIFVLDMGQPVRIRDLAEQMIRLSGLQPGRDIRIEFIGLRPGEKLHEELFYRNEEMRATVHPKLLLASAAQVSHQRLVGQLANLETAVAIRDTDAAVGMLCSMVPDFHRGPADSQTLPASAATASAVSLRLVK